MNTSLLNNLAFSRLPTTLLSRRDIEQVQQLAAAGLVIALVQEHEAKVLALTERGRAALERAREPAPRAAGGDAPSLWVTRLGNVLERTRQALS